MAKESSCGSNSARKLEVIENVIWKVNCLNKLLKFRKDDKIMVVTVEVDSWH